MRFIIGFRTPEPLRNMLKRLKLGDRERVKAVNFSKRWIRDGGRISVAFDAEDNTAEVLEAREYLAGDGSELPVQPMDTRLVQLDPDGFESLIEWMEDRDVEYDISHEMQAIVVRRR